MRSNVALLIWEVFYDGATLWFFVSDKNLDLCNVLICKTFALKVRFNALSRPIESALQKEGIPCRILGGHKFFERMEVSNLIYSNLVLLTQPRIGERHIIIPSTCGQPRFQPSLRSRHQITCAGGQAIRFVLVI